jgi:hypothetical protein
MLGQRHVGKRKMRMPDSWELGDSRSIFPVNSCSNSVTIQLMAIDITEADILAEVIAPGQPGLPPAFAQSILELAFTDQAKSRMDELAEKNSQGAATGDERDEMGKYMRVGNFINLMQAKARRSLSDSVGNG